MRVSFFVLRFGISVENLCYQIWDSLRRVTTEEGMNCGPTVPFHKAVRGGLLQRLKLGVGRGFLESLVLLHHGDVDELHILPPGTEAKP